MPSPERGALRRAIERHRDASARLAAVDQATNAAYEQRIALRHDLDAAEAELKDAKIAEPQRMVDRLMAGGEISSPIAELTTRIMTLRAQLTAAEAARRRLTAAHHQQSAAADWAQQNLEAALNAVIRSDPAIVARYEEFCRCRQRLVAAAAALFSLPENATPTGVRETQRVGRFAVTVGVIAGIREPPFVPDPNITSWIDALRDDPDAQLDPPPSTDDAKAA